MKKLILGCFAFIIATGAMAQQSIADNFVNGKIDQSEYIQQMTTYFQDYQTQRGKEEKMTKLIATKAKNYSVIAGLRNDKKLFEGKMFGQQQHLHASLRYILTPEDYRRYVKAVRPELLSNGKTKQRK